MKFRHALQRNRFVTLMLSGLLGLIILAGYLLHRATRPSHPLEIASERIVAGMPIDKAIAIVGRPPDDSPESSPNITMDYAVWYDDHQCHLEIRCVDGRVALNHFVWDREKKQSEGFLDRLLRWLHLAFCHVDQRCLFAERS
jgi:hypothetical protein